MFSVRSLPPVPVDHLSELPGVVLLHEEDGLPGLLLHAGGAGGNAGAAEHAGGDGCIIEEKEEKIIIIFCSIGP